MTPSQLTPEDGSNRRSFLSTLLMGSGLAAGYGACGTMGARYLYPAHDGARAWLFLARVDEFRVGDSISYRAPSGQRIAVARQAESGTAEDFVALSSTCPHLGCQVHWESQNERFFCPCHNGAFDASGDPLEGPPAEAGQSLPRFPVRVEDELLFIEVPVEKLARIDRMEPERGTAPPGPGHDPCLHSDRHGDLA